MTDFSPAEHYDRVTDAWREHLLGDELHYGVFDKGDESLPEATEALTRRMIDGARLEPGLRVLDVGCGTGAPACLLGAEQGVSVLGITTSQVGVDTANARAKAAGLDGVSFELRDGTDNGLEDASFDRVWVLESSHLMREVDRLMAECARVLRPGGRIVLCDIITRREIPFREVKERRADFAVLRAAFGDAHMRQLDRYAELAAAEGLDVDTVVDLTELTLPTFDRWRLNAAQHAEGVADLIGSDGLADFERSLDILEAFWRDGTMGYGLLAAAKPG